MADTKTSALTALTGMSLTDKLYVSNSGTDKHIPFDEFTETGTFTPTIEGTTTAGTQTYTTQAGHYERIGRLVHYSVLIILSAKDGATSGSLVVEGLPYTANAGIYSPSAISYTANITLTSSYFINGYVKAGTTQITLFESDGTTLAALTIADLNATSQIMLSGCYRAA